jgi:hypothetical protein
MDEYFITKKAVEIILENINDHFIKCLVSLSVKERYADDMNLIIGIIELLKLYMETRRNDILSSYIKYTNKSYYLQLTDNLFRLIQSRYRFHNKNLFLYDLLDKYKNPVIATPSSMIIRKFKDDTVRHRFQSEYESDLLDTADTLQDTADTLQDTTEATTPPVAKDAGTLFKEAYSKLKHNKTREFELRMMNSDLL